jgi:hypothetical protein
VEFFNKLNANERLAATGAVIVIIAWLVGLVGSFGLGVGMLTLLAAIAVLAIYFLKYSPSQSINWPAPIPLIVLGISGVAALLAVIGALQWLAIGSFFFGLGILAAIASAVGAVIMAWGAWQEYQAMPKSATSTSASGATTARASTPTSATGPTTATGPSTTATGPSTTATGPSTTATGPNSSAPYADPASTPPANPPYSDPNA